MRYLPKILQGLFKPVEMPPDHHVGDVNEMDGMVQDGPVRAPIEERIARLAGHIGDRMIAAEAATVTNMTARVEPLFADFARQIEDRR